MSSGRVYSDWLAPLFVAAVPLLVGTVYPNVIFNPVGSRDAYMFVGLGLHYHDPNVFAVDYKLTRIPWILIEYAFRHLLPPLAAQYTIQYSVHAALALCFYCAMRRLFATAPAFLVACFLSTYTELYSASPADYMNVFAAVLYVIAFLLVTVAARQRSPLLSYFGAGAVYAATVYTNTYFGLFAPILVTQAIVIRRSATFSISLRRSVVAAAAGAVAATMVFGVVAVSFGRPLNFVAPEITYISTYIHPATQWWYRPWSSGWWFNDESYFGILLATAIGGLFFTTLLAIRCRSSSTVSALRISVMMEFVFAFAVFAGLQSSGQAILEPNHVMFPLLIPCAMAIVAILAAERFRNYHPSALHLGLGYAIIVLTLCWPSIFHALRAPLVGLPAFIPSTLAVAVMLFFAVSSESIGAGRPQLWLAAFACTLAVVNVAGTSPLSARELFGTPGCSFRRDGYLTIMDLDRVVSSIKTRPSDVYVWVDDNERMTLANCGRVRPADIGWSFRSLGLAETILTPERTALENFRNLTGSRSSLYVLVASRQPVATERLMRNLRLLGFAATPEAIELHHGDISIQFSAVRAVRRSANSSAQERDAPTRSLD